MGRPLIPVLFFQIHFAALLILNCYWIVRSVFFLSTRTYNCLPERWKEIRGESQGI